MAEKVPDAQKMVQKIEKIEEITKNCPKLDDSYMEKILERRVLEAEAKLHEEYSEELEKVRQAAEEQVMMAEIKLEKYEEELSEKINKIKLESERKIKEAISETKIVKNELENFTSSVRDFLSRLFPIDLPETFDENILSVYEEKITTYLKELNKNKEENSRNLENILEKVEENGDDKLSFEERIINYQSVLMKTDTILKSLQNKIENEEKKWRKEFEKAKSIDHESKNYGAQFTVEEEKKYESKQPDEGGKETVRSLLPEKEIRDIQNLSKDENSKSTKIRKDDNQFTKWMNCGKHFELKIDFTRRDWTFCKRNYQGTRKVKFKIVNCSVKYLESVTEKCNLKMYVKKKYKMDNL